MNTTATAQATEGPPVLISRNGAIATVTFNRAARKNALDGQAWRLLDAAIRDLAADDDVRAVILTGAGGNFCAGADLSGRSADEHPLSRMRLVGNIALALTNLPKPVIAKVDGVAVGAGWNLALACDFVVASPAARFCQIFARRGLSIDLGGSWLLPRIAGLQQAKRLAMLAEMISAEEALSLGLVTWVKPATEIDGFAAELAGQLALMPPVALAQTKSLLNQGVTGTLLDAVASEGRAQTVNYATEDAPAAFRAFLEKAEPPAFTGRWAVT
jgi:2-(1,2-epoxy-1,2-dihydrophenyl)acetyl-CoA isomerase